MKKKLLVLAIGLTLISCKKKQSCFECKITRTNNWIEAEKKCNGFPNNHPQTDIISVVYTDACSDEERDQIEYLRYNNGEFLCNGVFKREETDVVCKLK